jgi:hypothetical protein
MGQTRPGGQTGHWVRQHRKGGVGGNQRTGGSVGMLPVDAATAADPETVALKKRIATIVRRRNMFTSSPLGQELQYTAITISKKITY